MEMWSTFLALSIDIGLSGLNGGYQLSMSPISLHESFLLVIIHFFILRRILYHILVGFFIVFFCEGDLLVIQHFLSDVSYHGVEI